MIYISHFKTYIPNIESSNKQVSECLGFYKNSYMRLAMERLNSEEIRIIAPMAKYFTSEELILNAFSKECINKEPSLYIDMRSSETYSLPAPDYYILKNLGCKNTKPINILGVADVPLIHAFSLYDVFDNENYYIASLSQRIEPKDNRNSDFILSDGAMSFTISDKNDVNGFCVENFIITSYKEDLINYIDKENGDVILRNNKDTRDLGLGFTIKRNSYEKYDFGCMDTFFSLLDIESKGQLKDKQDIVLVSAEAKTYTAITLKYFEESIE